MDKGWKITILPLLTMFLWVCQLPRHWSAIHRLWDRDKMLCRIAVKAAHMPFYRLPEFSASIDIISFLSKNIRLINSPMKESVNNQFIISGKSFFYKTEWNLIEERLLIDRTIIAKTFQSSHLGQKRLKAIPLRFNDTKRGFVSPPLPFSFALSHTSKNSFYQFRFHRLSIRAFLVQAWHWPLAAHKNN